MTVAANHGTAAFGRTPNKNNFEDIKLFGDRDVEINGRTPKIFYLSIAQGFGDKQTKESYVNILPKGDTDVTLRNVRTFRHIVLVEDHRPEVLRKRQRRGSPQRSRFPSARLHW